MLPNARDKAIVLMVYTHGYVSREQLRRLFFKKRAAGQGWELASIQAAGARLRKLARAGFLTRVAAPMVRGSGQYLYRLGPVGAKLLAAEWKIAAPPSASQGDGVRFLAVNHALEVVEFYIALKDALEDAGGAVLTWLGERDAAFRFLHQGRRRMIAPDAYCLWSLGQQSGSFFLEWERGHQALSIIGAKLDGYDAYYRRRAYLDHLGEIGLTPRLILVLPDRRRETLILGWMERQMARGRWKFLPTVMLGVRSVVLSDVLGGVWNRAGRSR